MKEYYNFSIREHYNPSMREHYNLSMKKHHNPSMKEYHNLSMRKSFISIITHIVLADNTLSIEEYYNLSMGKSSISTATHIVLADNTLVMNNSISKSTTIIMIRYIHNSLSWRWSNTNSLFIIYILLSFKDKPKSTLLSYRWEEFLKDYLDIAFKDIIIDIIIHEARIGYEGLSLNLSSDNHSFAMKIFDELS